MGKQCKHIHVLRFCRIAPAKMLVRDNPQAPKIATFGDGHAPADAKKSSKGKLQSW